MNKFDVLVVGGGMITHDQILPSLYQMQRDGKLGEISVCSQSGATVKKLADSKKIQEAFPSQSFTPYPDFRTVKDLTERYPELYQQVLNGMEPNNLVVMALPDQLHFECIMAALEAGQHVLAVKPLVMNYGEAQ